MTHLTNKQLLHQNMRVLHEKMDLSPCANNDFTIEPTNVHMLINLDFHFSFCVS